MRTILERVEYAQGIIDQAIDDNGDETNASDLLGDLMHWAQARALSFDALVQQARQHFEAEDDGQDVPTMSDRAYSREFGAAAIAMRKARRDQAGAGPALCGWCRVPIAEHTAMELLACEQMTKARG